MLLTSFATAAQDTPQPVPKPTSPTEATASSIPDVRMEPVFGGRTFREPVQVLGFPGDNTSLVIVERSGRVYRANMTGGEPVELLDLRKLVTDRNSEEGLLSLAFHPEFPSVPEIFVWYSTRRPRQTVLARFTIGADGADSSAPEPAPEPEPALEPELGPEPVALNQSLALNQRLLQSQLLNQRLLQSNCLRSINHSGTTTVEQLCLVLMACCMYQSAMEVAPMTHLATAKTKAHY